MWRRKKDKDKYKFDRMSLVVSPSITGVGYMVHIVNKKGVILGHREVSQNDWDSITQGNVTSDRFNPVRLLMMCIEKRRNEV